MRLSIVVVTYNSRDVIDACLDALAAHPPTAAHEIVVVDNASRDGTLDLVRARSRVRAIDAGENLGFAGGANLGARATTGDLILWLNPDTTVRRGALDQLIAALERHPDAAAAGPRLLDADDRAEVSWGRPLSLWAEVWQKTLVTGQRHRLWPVSAYVERLARRPRSVGWVSGACLLVRRGDAERVGLLDTRYFMYAEDVDFCLALRTLGRRVLFVPDAEVTHLRGRSAATAPEATATAYRRSQLAFYRKHHPRWVPVLRAYLKLRGVLPDTKRGPSHSP